MSSYVKEKVIRLPYTCTGLTDKFKDFSAARDYLESTFEAFKEGRFQIAPTESDFIDYVIERDRNSGEGEYGKIRKLYPSEQIRFGLIFYALFPHADLEALRVVEYCWYDCCEAPDYYNLEDDPFYKEII